MLRFASVGVRALLKGNFIMAPTLCFQKRVLGARRFREGLKFVLDWEMTTGLLLDEVHPDPAALPRGDAALLDLGEARRGFRLLRKL